MGDQPSDVMPIRNIDMPDASMPGALEGRFELLVQSVVHYAIYMLDPAGHIASWNSGAQHIKGYTAEEVLGRHFSMFYTQEDQALGLPERVLSIAEREGRYNGESWRVRRDGSRFRALVVVDAIRDPSGTLLGFAKVTRDITRQWEAQCRLEESERRLRLFAEGAIEYALCMLDTDGRIQDWNVSTQRVTGYTAEDVIGQPLDLLLEEAGVSGALLRRARETGSREEERRLRRKDGSFFLAQVAVKALADQDGVLHGFACMIRDVSEQRATQNALEDTREQLFQSQKLDALGQLTGGVAHDFNNILQAITGSLDVATLYLQRGEPGKAEHQLESAMNAVDKASHLTRRLLAFARRQPLLPTRFDLNASVASMIDLLERTVGATVSMRIDLCPEPLWITCDIHQLETSLINIAINGRDAMPHGGTLRISTGTASARTAKLHGEQVFACLTVEDSGIGMSREMASKAFDPFFTTKPLGQGTGLGLSMVHGFMEQSRGTVTLHSQPGEGTRVTLLFPLDDGEGETTAIEDA